jgi:KpsF/GutQ family protein
METKDIWEKAQKVWRRGADELLRLSEYVDPEIFARCVRLLGDHTGRVFTTGVGTSATAARKIAHTLSCIERPACFLSPGDAVHGGLGTVRKGDICILLSKGGGTAEIVGLLPSLRKKGAYIIGVTEVSGSELGHGSDLLLQVKVEKEADPFNMLATTSTMTTVALFDALSIVLMDYTGFSKEKFLTIHPSGAVGARLSEVKDRP